MENQHIKYCWLDILTGEFSDSWSEAEMELLGGEKHILKLNRTNKEYKLIKFKCVNNPEFEFNSKMVIR